jgi:AcrR family transcriptional regulator
LCQDERVTKAAKPTKTKVYHHGDLRRALLAAAFQLVKKRGLRELNLRELARKVGVTHAAPYHHFADRDALLDAMAEQAFGELDAAMAEAKRGVEEPGERVFRLGCAYVDFARARPERVEVMFRRASTSAVNQALLDKGACAFQHLVDALSACQEAGLAPAGDPLALALSAWSLVHGFSALWVEGPLDAMPFYQGKFEELRDATLRSFGQWLQAAAKRTP